MLLVVLVFLDVSLHWWLTGPTLRFTQSSFGLVILKHRQFASPKLAEETCFFGVLIIISVLTRTCIIYLLNSWFIYPLDLIVMYRLLPTPLSLFYQFCIHSEHKFTHSCAVASSWCCLFRRVTKLDGYLLGFKPPVSLSLSCESVKWSGCSLKLTEGIYSVTCA